MPNNILLLTISKFYSLIVIKKMDVDQLSNTRRVETLLKLCIKKNADILYLKFTLRIFQRNKNIKVAYLSVYPANAFNLMILF